jgi:formate hydrogenlyase subunit 3/multisubunit Na+/H+ antiporter MnhD subunit
MTVSAPLIWIVAPVAAALLLLLLSRWPRLISGLGAALAASLALLAWRLPVGEIIELAGRSFTIEPALVFFGRRLELLPAQLPLLALIYLAAAFWLGGTYAAHTRPLAVPLGLTVVALLTAALAVQPFLYAALLIEMAVLACVPLLTDPQSPPGRGVLRFITFQTFGMPFILFTGNLLAGIESNPGDPILSLRVGMLMGLGFGFLLALFPFHSWLPLLGEESHPYVAAFVFVFLPQMVLLFGLEFLERYAWMRSLPVLFTALRWVALLMILFGGMLAAFQAHLGRLLGYAAMLEIGFSLYALALLPTSPNALALHFALLPGRLIAFLLAALALATLRAYTPHGALTLPALQGLGWRCPLAAGGLLLALFSLAGLPVLASFAPRFGLIALGMATNPLAALAALSGGMGILFTALRTLMALFARSDVEAPPAETPGQAFFLFGGGALLVFLGLFLPRLVPWFASLAAAFAHLAQ